MTYSNTNKNKEQSLSAEGVAAYLDSNPEFFLRNPAVLKQLSIPHAVTGNVHSLIERQVTLLRDENNELKKTIQQGDNLANVQRHLQHHIYQFTFELLKTDR